MKAETQWSIVIITCILLFFVYIIFFSDSDYDADFEQKKAQQEADDYEHYQETGEIIFRNEDLNETNRVRAK